MYMVDGRRTAVPDLAERWEVSPDGKIYTFFLRDGVKYHDGTPFTSADVEATFKRILSPPAGLAITMTGLFEGVENVQAVDRRTVRFSLKEPRSYLLEVFAVPQCVIYSKRSLDANNQDLRKVIAPGTGPYMLKERREGEKMILARNPNYWNPDIPYIDAIELLHLPEWTDRGTAVLTGRADMSPNTSVEMLREAQKRSDMGWAQQPSESLYIVYYNCQRKPLNDARVRRAISLAVSHQDLLKVFESYEGVKFSSWIPRASDLATPPDQLEKRPGYRPGKAEDIPEAKRLMAEAGYPDGVKGMDLVCASVASHAQVLAPAFQDQLKRTLNIESKIRVVERGVLIEEWKAGRFDFSLFSHALTTTLDPSPLWNVSFKTGGAQNYPRYSNPPFDRLLEQVNRELNASRRRQMVAQAQDLLDENPPWFVIGWLDYNVIWRNYVKGLEVDKRLASDLSRLDTIWLDK
jgi:ABC-type transport system substrate-binding protein